MDPVVTLQDLVALVELVFATKTSQHIHILSYYCWRHKTSSRNFHTAAHLNRNSCIIFLTVVLVSWKRVFQDWLFLRPQRKRLNVCRTGKAIIVSDYFSALSPTILILFSLSHGTRRLKLRNQKTERKRTHTADNRAQRKWSNPLALSLFVAARL